MGSYESVRTTIDFVAKATWLCLEKGLPYDPCLADHFRWIFEIYAKPWLRSSRWRRMVGRLRLTGPPAGDLTIWREYWKKITGYPEISLLARRLSRISQPSHSIQWICSTARRFQSHRRQLQANQRERHAFRERCQWVYSANPRLGLDAVVVDMNGTGYSVSDGQRAGHFGLRCPRGSDPDRPPEPRI